MNELSENPWYNKPNALDSYRIRLNGDRYENSYKSPTLQVSKDVNNFRFQVWLNDDKQTPAILVRLNIRSMLMFLEMTLKLIKEKDFDNKYTAETTTKDVAGIIPSTSISVYMNDTHGVIWEITQPGGGTIPFYFKGDTWTRFKLNDEPLDPIIHSILDATTLCNTFIRLITLAFHNEFKSYKEESDINEARRVFSEKRKAEREANTGGVNNSSVGTASTEVKVSDVDIPF